MPRPDPATAQLDALVGLVRRVVADDVVGLYLHGSAVLGGLRPTSDLDLMLVLRRSLSADRRRALVAGILPVSGPPVAGTHARPVELTAVVHADVRPWRYPPRRDFRYGEWLRAEYEAGVVPEPSHDPDLATLLEVVRRAGRPFVGPPPAGLLDPVPPGDLVRGPLEDLPALLADLADDTRNVLLTLARMWVTTATGEIVTKDAAAAWATVRLPDPAAAVVDRAGRGYLEGAYPSWDDLPGAVDTAARLLVENIRAAAAAGPGDGRPAV